MMKKYFRISFFSFAVSRRSDWRWLQFALIAIVLTSCTVQMKVKEVTSLPVPKQQVERTRSAAAPWPRLFWEQIEAADTLGAIAVADNDGNGYWSDSLRWESGVLKLGIDTAATRAYARSVSAGGGSTQDLFSQFTDVLGFSPAVADDPNDVLTFRSPNSTISFSAWNDDATYGDYLAFDLASNAVSWSSLKAAVQDSIQLERGADGNGVFDVSNSGSSVPDNMTLDVTDEIIFSTENINQNPVMIFEYDAGGSYSTPGFIEFNLNETTAPSLGTISDFVTLDDAGVQKFYWRYVATASAEQITLQSESDVSLSIGSGDDFTLSSDADLIIGDGGETDILVNFSSIQNTPAIDNIMVLDSSTNVLGYRDISTLGTDDQTIDVFSITSNTLNLSLEDDAEATKTVDLSPYLDNTDAQTLSFSSPNLTITGGNSVDISAIQDGTGTDDQTIDVFSITSNTLNLSLESDGEATKTVSLLPYLDNTDTQLTEEQVEDFVGGMVTGNTESGITVTYQDTDGTLDFSATDNSTANETWWIAGDTGSETGIKADDGYITFAGGTNVTTAYNSTSNTLTINSTASGGGTMDDWTFGADSGTSLITDGNIAKVTTADGGIGTTMSGDNVVIGLNFETATSIGTFPATSDILLLRDAGTGEYRKLNASGFVIPGTEAAAQIVLNGVSAEPTGSEGGLFYDTDDDKVKMYSSATADWGIMAMEEDVPAKMSGFTEYTSTTSVSPTDGTIILLDADEGAANLTLTINPINLVAGDRIIVIVDMEGTYSTTIQTSGAQVFYFNDVDTTFSSLSYSSGSTDYSLQMFYDGVDFFTLTNIF